MRRTNENREAQHARGDAVEPLVAFETQAPVRFERIESLILQTIGAQLVDETDAAPLLRQIEQHAASGLRDGRNRFAQLNAAIAVQRAQEIAGETFRVDARQNRPIARRIADRIARCSGSPVPARKAATSVRWAASSGTLARATSRSEATTARS